MTVKIFFALGPHRMGFAVDDVAHTQRSINDNSIMIYRNRTQITVEWQCARSASNVPTTINRIEWLWLGEDPEWENKYFGEFQIITGLKFTDCRALQFIIRSITRFASSS